MRFLTWINQTLCGWAGHDYQHYGEGRFVCAICDKEMPDDEF